MSSWLWTNWKLVIINPLFDLLSDVLNKWYLYRTIVSQEGQRILCDKSELIGYKDSLSKREKKSDTDSVIQSLYYRVLPISPNPQCGFHTEPYFITLFIADRKWLFSRFYKKNYNLTGKLLDRLITGIYQ